MIDRTDNIWADREFDIYQKLLREHNLINLSLEEEIEHEKELKLLREKSVEQVKKERNEAEKQVKLALDGYDVSRKTNSEQKKYYEEQLRINKELARGSIENSKAVSDEGQKAAFLSDSVKHTQSALRYKEKLANVDKTMLQNQKEYNDRLGNTAKLIDKQNRVKNAAAKADEINNKYRELAREGEMSPDDASKAAIEEIKKMLEDLGLTGDDIYSKVAKGLIDKIPGGDILKAINVVSKITSKIHDTIGSAMDQASSVFTQYMGKIDSRLQGTDQTFSSIRKDFSGVFTGSRFTTQEKIIENVAALSEAGIAFNLEQRALLQTLSEKMVSTFDALDASLTRLIRLQQADLTYSSMGVESAVTQLLNGIFQDSSYLSDVYDSVNSAIIDATSQMNVDQATGFTYAVQKWLGSLYSVGMSSDVITSIAQGLSWLSTGNVSQLTSNTGINTLLAQSAANAGLNYADLLTNGLTADTTNDLLQSMVEYLASIADNTQGATKSAWAQNILNMSVSDLRAAQNITSGDITSIANSVIQNASEAAAYTTAQLNAIESRTSIAEQVNNVVDNLIFTMGANMADDSASYLTWKAAEVVNDIMGEIETPWSELVSGIASTIQVLSTLGSVTELAGDLFSSWNNGGINNLFGYNWSDLVYQERGTGFAGIAGASTGTKSGSVVNSTTVGAVTTGISNSSSYSYSNVEEETSLASQAAQTAETITGVEEESLSYTTSDIYEQLFELQNTPIKVKLSDIENNALQALALSLKVEDLETLTELLSTGTIEVKVKDSGDYVMNTLSYVRSNL